MKAPWYDLKKEGSRRVSHHGERPWEARHVFSMPAGSDAIDRAEAEIGITVPSDLRQFWQLGDGAMLFESTHGEPWGWRLLGTDHHLEVQHKWRRKFFDHWHPGWLVVGELLGQQTVLVWDGSHMRALWPQGGGLREVEIASSFTELVERIAAADGGLWWAWG